MGEKNVSRCRHVLVLDCGATNVRAMAVDPRGRIVHGTSLPNRVKLQERGKGWLVWDLDEIWRKLLLCARTTVGVVGKNSFVAVTVASFSDDGAPVSADGKLLYPVISWQCPRTVAIAETIGALISPQKLFAVTGEQVMRQHSLFRLLWLKENVPGLLEKMHAYLMVPGILNYRLTGEMTNDPTTADSMMLMDLRRRRYSPEMLRLAGVDEHRLGTMVEPGTAIGGLLLSAARRMGLEPGIPVVAAGHDTQFAVCGSGAVPGEIVLSSGTWEILFLRGRHPMMDRKSFNLGIKNECDAVPGLYNAGMQWIGSGVLEWFIELFGDSAAERRERHRFFERCAEKVPAGAGGVMMEPSLLPGSGIGRIYHTHGTLLGCTMRTGSPEVYRAVIEGLSFQLRRAVESIRTAGAIDPDRLVVVGGGSRNRLWNRIRADVLDLPIHTTRQAENTVVGAALFGFIGAGWYRNFEEARRSADFSGPVFEPTGTRGIYDELYNKFIQIGPLLEKFYRNKIEVPDRRISPI